MSKRKWVVLIVLVSLLAAVVITRKISPKWYQDIEKYPRDTFVSLSALFRANKEVVEAVRETVVRQLVADKLINQRELSEKESLQLHLYNQVAYDYKKYREIRKVIEGVPGVQHGESNWVVDAVGDSGLAYGVGQFHEKTFYGFAKEAGVEGEWHNPYDQLTLMAWAWDNGKQNAWTVYRYLKTKGEM